LLLAGCAAPNKEQAIQTALDAHLVAQDAARAACILAMADRSITREPGFDAWCAELISPEREPRFSSEQPPQ
jgi:hypothetical protein